MSHLPHQDLCCSPIQLFASLVAKSYAKDKQKEKKLLKLLHSERPKLHRVLTPLHSGRPKLHRVLTLLHSERPKLHRVLAILSAIGLKLEGTTKSNMKIVVPVRG